MKASQKTILLVGLAVIDCIVGGGILIRNSLASVSRKEIDYSKMLEWHEEGEEYIYYLSVAADSVSEEIQNLEVGDTNIERACTLLAKAVAVIEDIDVSELEAALKQSMEEEGDYVSIGNVGIFWYMIEEDYIMLSAYPQQ